MHETVITSQYSMVYLEDVNLFFAI